MAKCCGRGRRGERQRGTRALPSYFRGMHLALFVAVMGVGMAGAEDEGAGELGTERSVPEPFNLREALASLAAYDQVSIMTLRAARDPRSNE